MYQEMRLMRGCYNERFHVEAREVQYMVMNDGVSLSCPMRENDVSLVEGNEGKSQESLQEKT